MIWSIEERQIAFLGASRTAVDECLERLSRERLIDRIWKKDPDVWSEDDGHRKIISNSLGWLEVASSMHSQVTALEALADEVRREFDAVVVLGMGGSSLCSEVLRRSFPQQKGFPRLSILDSTVPAAVRALERSLDMARSLFIVASKSGTTTEPQMFYRYFWGRVQQIKGDRAGENFIAVTDPGTLLQREAERDGFRRVFLNPPDIGGRYSALSFFGMVPAALSGIDVNTLLDRALRAVEACSADDLGQNPAARLGATLGTLALEGRDKLTIIASEPVASVGLWIEQLVAESTGKNGVGILPVAGEPLLPVPAYGNDRMFVSIRTKESDDLKSDRLVRDLRDSGIPIVEHILDDPLDLGAEFFIWEFATAVAGHLLGIDPFDQPNVQESKDNTKRLIDQYRSTGKLPQQEPLVVEGNLRLFGSRAEATDGGSLARALTAHLALLQQGDYFAITEYIEETPEHDRLIDSMREAIARRFGVATTTGYGPRFLHSTGQLHKGGGANGVFLQITSRDPADVAIPGEPFTFGVLKDAQALGDFESLASRGRRAIRVDLGKDATAGLTRLHDVLVDLCTT